LLALLARPASAHQTSMKQLDLRVADRTIELTLRAGEGDVASAIGRDAATLPRAELLADPNVAVTVTSWVRVLVEDAVACAPAPDASPPRVSEDGDPRLLAVHWRLICPRSITSLTLDFFPFFLLDATHTMVVHVEGQGEAIDTVIGLDDSPLQLRLAAPPRSFPRWLHLGIGHIFGGTDHLCFVVTLLLAAVLTRAPSSSSSANASQNASGDRRHRPHAGPTWRIRPWRQILRSTAVLITSFSAAHSLTLIAASLGWISLPGRLVETAIALSIGYAAVENSIRPDAPWRWMLTFGFGLVHGLGFASALRELLPPDRVTVPLLAFNLGVEIGQLVIVAAALPLLLALAHLLRANRYRSRLLPISSVLLAAVALVWSFERAFGLAIW
jgi:hypothetical protein